MANRRSVFVSCWSRIPATPFSECVLEIVWYDVRAITTPFSECVLEIVWYERSLLRFTEYHDVHYSELFEFLLDVLPKASTTC